MDEENGKVVGMLKGKDRKVWRFSSNGFWKNIGRLVLYPTFGIGGSMLWEKEEAQKISRKKIKTPSIRLKFDLYEVCISYFIPCLIYFTMAILPPPVPYLWHL